MISYNTGTVIKTQPAVSSPQLARSRPTAVSTSNSRTVSPAPRSTNTSDQLLKLKKAPPVSNSKHFDAFFTSHPAHLSRIDPKERACDVVAWLASKGISDLIIAKFIDINWASFLQLEACDLTNKGVPIIKVFKLHEMIVELRSS